MQFEGIYEFVAEMRDYFSNVLPVTMGERGMYVFLFYIEEFPTQCDSMVEEYQRFSTWHKGKFPGNIIPYSKVFTLNYLCCLSNGTAIQSHFQNILKQWEEAKETIRTFPEHRNLERLTAAFEKIKK